MLSFLLSLVLLGIDEIAVEIEDPFGEDPNDIDLMSGLRQMDADISTLLYNMHGDTPAQRSRPRGSKLRVIGYVIGGSKLGLPRPVVGRSHRGFDEAIGDGRRAPFMRDDVRRAEALRG